MNSKKLAGTTILATLVVVFDYSMKFSGLKIPFPWLPYLKFDFTGAPIVLSMLLFGFIPGVTTSTVAFLAILARSGDFVGASMKGLAELATILGMAISHRWLKNTKTIGKASSLILGVTSRILIMFFANLIILPVYNKIPLMAVVAVSPLVAAFNGAQGAISILLGYSLYNIILHRTSPSLQE
jgi:riboflavin transporter FmnP